jgi:hypothetical protein
VRVRIHTGAVKRDAIDAVKSLRDAEAQNVLRQRRRFETVKKQHESSRQDCDVSSDHHLPAGFTRPLRP